MTIELQNLHSPGKLLLTGEYFVLDGAKALAVPTKVGQSFSCREKKGAVPLLVWNAYHLGDLWLSFQVNYHSWEILTTNNMEATQFVINTLKIVQEKSSIKLKDSIAYTITTNLEFPPDYGLGSSSTLMTNLAQWANINAFELNQLALGGSGYDIAVALKKKPIIFQIENQQPTDWAVEYQPSFAQELIFLHLGKKQNSREGILRYRSKKQSLSLVREISEITENVLKVNDLSSFSQLMNSHERLVSRFLEIPTVKSSLFSDCPVFIKSLGAWGGDFVMSQKFDGYEEYFTSKGIKTILDWKDLILNSS